MDDMTLSRGSAGKPEVLRVFEFYGGCIRVKISVKNTSSLAILDSTLELEADEQILHFDRCEPAYTEKKGKIILGNINPNTDRTIAFYLDPLICAKEGTDINCRVNFKYADGTPDTVHMETLKIKGVCPTFRTENDINIGRLKELIKELHSQDSKVYTIPKRVDMTESLKTCRNVIQQHDVRHIKTFKTADDKTYECWYYGKTKVTKKDIVIKCAIRRDTESIEICASGNDPENITWLLAEIGRNLTNEFEKLGKVQPVFNVVVKNSMLKGSNLLSFCDLNGICGGNVVIEDSFVDDTNVASWMQEDKEKTRIEEQKKLERTSYKKFFAVVLVLGVLLLGYWMLAPGANNAPETTAPIIITPPSDIQKTFTNTIGMEFVFIPAGEFDMGSPSGEDRRDSDELPRHRVEIAKIFYMGKYEVTQKQWRDVMGNNPSYFKGDNLPVERVSWNDAQEFIKKLNGKEGTNKYRLPSEAEWEYAARAGTTTRYSFGDDESKLGDYAWYEGNSGSETHEVGQKKPNPWGLYDMHGNVWEWVQDKYHDLVGYDGAPGDGSAWESGDGTDRVWRGGDWSINAKFCRSAERSGRNPGGGDSTLGFRIVKDL